MKKHWFESVWKAVMLLFFAIMGFVLYVSFSRPAGRAKIDVAQIQKIRYDHRLEKMNNE